MAKEYKIKDGIIYEREIERINAGTCPFCGEPVWASEGQAITYRRKKEVGTGEIIEEPIHKKCKREEIKYHKGLK